MTKPDVIIRMKGADRLGARHYKLPTLADYDAMTCSWDDLKHVLTAWNIFQWKHKMGGLTVFRRWLRIFHPDLIVWVYNR